MENELGTVDQRALLVVELRGFTASSVDMAKELDAVGISVERIRAGAREVVDGLLNEAAVSFVPLTGIAVGGDTWHFTFKTMLDAVRFGAMFLSRALSVSAQGGLYYLKPSLGVAWGVPSIQDGRFLDDDSIAAYRAADGGKAFILHVVGDAAIARAGAIDYLELIKAEGRIAADPGDAVMAIDWQRYPQSELGTMSEVNSVRLADLLLDTEVLYSDTAREALERVTERQREASEVLVFGGPASLVSPMFLTYVRQTLHELRSREDLRMSVVAYLPRDEKDVSAAWLELCQRMHVEFPKQYAYRAFAIDGGQLRPFSYQVFDREYVHIGLRSYVPQRQTSTLSSAVLIRSKQLAQRFSGEFLESFRSLDPWNFGSYTAILGELTGNSNDIVARAHAAAEEVLRPGQ